MTVPRLVSTDTTVNGSLKAENGLIGVHSGKVYERSTYSNTSTYCTLIQFNASDYKANGYMAHFRFRVKSVLKDSYPSDNEFIINYSHLSATIFAVNNKYTTTNNIVTYVRARYPNSTTYIDTGNYLISFRTGRASTNFIVEVIEADIPYTIPSTMATETTTNTSYASLTPGNYAYSNPLMWTGYAVGNINGSSASATSATTTVEVRRNRFIGEASQNYALCGVATDGAIYRLLTSGKKFPLPIRLTTYLGSGYSANTSTTTRDVYATSMPYTNLSNSTYQGGSGYTCPTLTTSDGGKPLYVRGSLDFVDNKPVFIPDGTVTLDATVGGYTYIPFGEVYKSSTSAPTSFYWDFEHTVAHTLSSEGKLTHIDGREIGGSSDGTVQLQDVIVGSSSNPWTLNTEGSTAPLYDEEFPYYSIITREGVTSNTYVQVAYSSEQSVTMYYSPVAQTDTDKIYIFARADMGQQVIPTISIGMDHSDITVDSTPISGSTNPISSGGVYANCVRIDGAQTVVGEKSFQGITYKAISGTFDTSSSIHSPIYWRDGSSNIGAWVERMHTNEESASQVNIGVREFKSGNQNIAMMNLRLSDSGTAWLEAPNRTYNQSNTRDVVTIGTLNQNITMSGLKWFTTSDGASIHILDTRKTRGTVPSSDQYTVLYFVDKNNLRLGQITHSQFADGANRMDIQVGKDDSNNVLRLDVQINSDGSHTIAKEGIKNGTYYWSDLLDQHGNQRVEGTKYFNPYTTWVKSYDIDRRYRPGTYYCAGYSFCDKNNQTIGELRMTYDAGGSRRIEVNVLDANGGDHWVVLNNITV